MPSEQRFAVVKKILEAKGYRLDRVSGSHHIFEKPVLNQGLFPCMAER